MYLAVTQEQQQEVLKLITGQLLKEQQAEARAKKQKEESEAAKARIAAGARVVAQAASRDLHDDADTIPAQVSPWPTHNAQEQWKWALSHSCKSKKCKIAVEHPICHLQAGRLVLLNLMKEELHDREAACLRVSACVSGCFATQK